MKNRTVYFLSFVFLLSITLVIFFESIQGTSDSNGEGRRLIIMNYVDHPVLNTIENELITSIRKEYGVDILKIETVTAQGNKDEIPSLARTVLATEPDLLITVSTPVSVGTFREANDKQRLLYTFVTDPTTLGDSLGRTNSTGLSDAVNYASNVSLIVRMFGQKATIGFAYNPNEPNSVAGLRSLQQILLDSQLTLKTTSITSEADIPNAISNLLDQIDVLYIGGDNLTVGAFPLIKKLAIDKGVPVIASDSGSIEEGAIAGYSVDYVHLGLKTAEIVIKILSGDEPREIPRSTISGDELILNMNAAGQAGIDIDASLLKEADRIIR